MKKYQWNVLVDGIVHNVGYKQGTWSGKHTISIDGVDSVINSTSPMMMIVVDVPVWVAGKECRLVKIGKKVDFVVDGRYLSNQEIYVPTQSMPKWNWVFLVLSFLAPILVGFGLVPILLAFSSATVVTRISISPKMKTPIKILSCFGVVIGLWAFIVLLVIVTALAQSV